MLNTDNSTARTEKTAWVITCCLGPGSRAAPGLGLAPGQGRGGRPGQEPPAAATCLLPEVGPGGAGAAQSMWAGLKLALVEGRDSGLGLGPYHSLPPGSSNCRVPVVG